MTLTFMQFDQHFELSRDYLSWLPQYILTGPSACTVAFEPGIAIAPAALAEVCFVQIVDDGTAAWRAPDRLGSNQEHHICGP